MAKKKPKTKEKDAMTTQLNVRVPNDMVDRIDQARIAFAMDRTGFLKLILAEQLARYERRAQAILNKEETKD